MKPEPSSIRNIIFDYGGVILNIDYNLTVEAFRQLGLKDFNKLYSKAIQTDLFDKLEKGDIDESFFFQTIRELSGMGLSDDNIRKAWNAIILDMPDKRIKLLEKLKVHYRLFLLSNTNSIHYQVYMKQLKERFDVQDFSCLFEKTYFSFQLGIKKPDPEIFELVIRENGLIPFETLFIDDSIQHIQGAEKTGLKTYLLPPSKDIIEVFDKKTLRVMV